MNFLMIENRVEAPIQAFLVSGLSTSRGDAGKIGQFGTGNKFAITLLLRNGLNPVIFSGNEKFAFSVEKDICGAVVYDKVVYQKGMAKKRDTNWALENGAMDWRDTRMALREFVSNAIDASDKDMTIAIVDNARAKSGYTRVFIPLNNDVQEFYDNISDYFLHFKNAENFRIIEKSVEGPAKIFRKGVFVRTINSSIPSLFDYNFGDELKIDESRNLEDYTAAYYAAYMLNGNKDSLKRLFRSFSENKEYWEHDFSQYAIGSGEMVKSAWEETQGTAVPVLNASELQVVCGKGYQPITVPQAWLNAMDKSGITTSAKLVANVEKDNKICEATPETMKTLHRVWQWLTDVNMTHGKVMPPCYTTDSIMSSGTQTQGYYHDGKVYINREASGNTKVMLEELAHYITEATDNSRDFQDFAFRIAMNAFELLE